jgi:hypothetical protein
MSTRVAGKLALSAASVEDGEKPQQATGQFP